MTCVLIYMFNFLTFLKQIQVLISEAFKNLRMLNQFYQPSLVWINELGKDVSLIVFFNYHIPTHS